MHTIESGTIFTNVAVSDDGTPWWEGKDGNEPCPFEFLTDWKGNRRRVSEGGEPFAHANSRFTAPARQCPSLSEHWEDWGGVPIDALIFGGRRDDTMPLVLEAFDWNHGVFIGATMGSKTTAAATGQTGVLRRDPFAMLPFCGYHMGDYFAHWVALGKSVPSPPKLFAVNWFRKEGGTFLWPGFGDNVRALIWIHERIRERGNAQNTPAGRTPLAGSLHMEGLGISPERVARALQVDKAEWFKEADAIAEHFARFGDKLPPELAEELAKLRARLG
jgi:phosphoenolpyruvate carboxykinase (GTP)